MEEASFGPGATILTIAIAAGWVAVGAMILRGLLFGIKSLYNKFKGKENQCDFCFYRAKKIFVLEKMASVFDQNIYQ